MNKATRILLAIGLILAVAAPAFAAGEFKFSGFYQLQAYSLQLKSAAKADGDSQQFIDQRLRAKLNYTLNENVAIVYQAEIDTVWGEPDKNAYTKFNGESADAASGGGGLYDTDGINIETKNLFLDLKSGDTSAQIGLINLSDQYQGLIYGAADMAGISATHKIGATTLNVLYSKWSEDEFDSRTTATKQSRRSDWDDTDFYGVAVNHKFSDAFKAGATVNFLDVNDANGKDTSERETFFYGLNGEFTSGNFGIDGFVLFQDGEYKNVYTDDVDTNAWAASAKAKMKLENGDIGFRVIYISEDDDTEDADGWYGNFSGYDFVGENQMIFLTDKFVANATKERYAMDDAAAAGFGLWGFVLSGNHTLPQDAYLNWGAGYYRAVDDKRNGGDIAADERHGKTLGYELCARIGKKYFEKVDVSLSASFADFGSFYDDSSVDDVVNGDVEDPDSIYKTYLMVRVPF